MPQTGTQSSRSASASVAAVGLAPVLTPHGQLTLLPLDDAEPIAPALARQLTAAFGRGSGHGLLELSAAEPGATLPAVFGYWREFSARFMHAVCALPELESGAGLGDMPTPSPAELVELVLAAPPMQGAEYLSTPVLDALWGQLHAAVQSELAAFDGTLSAFLKARYPDWNQVGRIHLHLAENRFDDRAPFAFMATYSVGLSAQAKPQHLPLGRALQEYSGAANQRRLLALLLPIQRAAERCAWLRAMVDSGEIFHPLRWTAREAYELLTSIPTLEAAGVVVRVPASWNSNRALTPQVMGRVGGTQPAGLGASELLQFRAAVTLDGEELTATEVEQLLSGTEGLVLLRGKWVTLDRGALGRMLGEFKSIERTAKREGLTLSRAMQLLAGADIGAAGADGAARADETVARVVAEPWLAAALESLRSPEGLAQLEVGGELKATLRPYQHVGVRWLHMLSELGLGACLADDMGLGKTVQVLALLLAKKSKASAHPPSLIVAPASLLANWAAELARFAPSLRVLVAHTAFTPAVEIERAAKHLSRTDVVITSYGSVLRMTWLAESQWRLLVLDEAQAIKNPGARQTRAVKKLHAHARIALTGTPVENRLSDLWSIFDFLNPGLLGSAKEFGAFTKRLSTRPEQRYRPLRDLVRPYILRRLKTDKSVISDLPDKIEVKAFCRLSRRQAALYEQSVSELGASLLDAKGIQRKGVVLAFLTRFKQICNHPSQWLGDGRYAEADSGKLGRLREVAEVVAAKQEKMLVFTQFRELTEPLAGFLASVFGRLGCVLHGGTPVGKRRQLVERFQQDESVPFMVLSLKAGGTGLNLTAATHVVHFDRWWNPAVEDQASDRAFRIGQTRHVLVHKFVCRGTLEEQIDTLIESKRQLSRDLLAGGAEHLLTELADDELLKLVALDHRSATLEA